VAPTFVVGEGSICFFEGRSQLSMFVAFLNELPSASAGGVLLSLISFRRMDRVAVNYVAIDDTQRGITRSSEQSCIYARPASGADCPPGKAGGPRKNDDGQSIRLDPVYFLQILNEAFHH